MLCNDIERKIEDRKRKKEKKTTKKQMMLDGWVVTFRRPPAVYGGWI